MRIRIEVEAPDHSGLDALDFLSVGNEAVRGVKSQLSLDDNVYLVHVAVDHDVLEPNRDPERHRIGKRKQA